MKYVPYEDINGAPNIIVDGKATNNTLITLSHWPLSKTPYKLKDDLSAQIVFKYLENPEFHVNADIVSNNHFDEDGLVSMYILLNPDEAFKNREMLIDIASAGDFGTYCSREAARLVFVLSMFADPELSPIKSRIFTSSVKDENAALYREVLPLFPEMLKSPDRYKKYWQNEEEMLTCSEKAIREGIIKIKEKKELDLAIVTIPDALPERPMHRFTLGQKAVCHPMALHNATNCFRILLMQGKNYELQYRYESWVQYISRKPLPRVDLAPLAKELNLEEKKGYWEFEGVEHITPKLSLQDAEESNILPEQFIQKVEQYLINAKGAWNPYEQ